MRRLIEKALGKKDTSLEKDSTRGEEKFKIENEADLVGTGENHAGNSEPERKKKKNKKKSPAVIAESEPIASSVPTAKKRDEATQLKDIVAEMEEAINTIVNNSKGRENECADIIRPFKKTIDADYNTVGKANLELARLNEIKKVVFLVLASQSEINQHDNALKLIDFLSDWHSPLLMEVISNEDIIANVGAHFSTIDRLRKNAHELVDKRKQNLEAYNRIRTICPGLEAFRNLEKENKNEITKQLKIIYPDQNSIETELLTFDQIEICGERLAQLYQADLAILESCKADIQKENTYIETAIKGTDTTLAPLVAKVPKTDRLLIGELDNKKQEIELVTKFILEQNQEIAKSELEVKKITASSWNAAEQNDHKMKTSTTTAARNKQEKGFQSLLVLWKHDLQRYLDPMVSNVTSNAGEKYRMAIADADSVLQKLQIIKNQGSKDLVQANGTIRDYEQKMDDKIKEVKDLSDVAIAKMQQIKVARVYSKIHHFIDKEIIRLGDMTYATYMLDKNKEAIPRMENAIFLKMQEINKEFIEKYKKLKEKAARVGIADEFIELEQKIEKAIEKNPPILYNQVVDGLELMSTRIDAAYSQRRLDVTKKIEERLKVLFDNKSIIKKNISYVQSEIQEFSTEKNNLKYNLLDSQLKNLRSNIIELNGKLQRLENEERYLKNQLVKLTKTLEHVHNDFSRPVIFPVPADIEHCLKMAADARSKVNSAEVGIMLEMIQFLKDTRLEIVGRNQEIQNSKKIEALDNMIAQFSIELNNYIQQGQTFAKFAANLLNVLTSTVEKNLPELSSGGWFVNVIRKLFNWIHQICSSSKAEEKVMSPGLFASTDEKSVVCKVREAKKKLEDLNTQGSQQEPDKTQQSAGRIAPK